MGPKKPVRQFPRDILITLADAKIKRRILNIAKGKNGLLFMEKRFRFSY